MKVGRSERRRREKEVRKFGEERVRQREKKREKITAMEAAARRSGGGLWEGMYRVVMRRNSVYVTFVIAGAFVGERVCCFFSVLRLFLLNLEISRFPDLILLIFGFEFAVLRHFEFHFVLFGDNYLL